VPLVKSQGSTPHKPQTLFAQPKGLRPFSSRHPRSVGDRAAKHSKEDSYRDEHPFLFLLLDSDQCFARHLSTCCKLQDKFEVRPANSKACFAGSTQSSTPAIGYNWEKPVFLVFISIF